MKFSSAATSDAHFFIRTIL